MAGRTGYNATLSIGAGYTGAGITNISVTVDHEPVEVSDLASAWKERKSGLKDWSMTGTKNYITQVFVTMAASGNTSVVATIKDQDGTTIFTGNAFITRGLITLPMGAATEEVTLVGTGAAPTHHA